MLVNVALLLYCKLSLSFGDNKIFGKAYPANIYLFKVNDRNVRKRCEICSKLIIKTPEGCQ